MIDDLLTLDIRSENGLVILETSTIEGELAIPFDPLVARAVAVKLMLCADEAEGVGAS
jgi:hypothetical protein